MPHYHFNTYDQMTLDQEAIALFDLRAALYRALRLSGAPIRLDHARLQLGEGWQIGLNDDLGRVLFRPTAAVLEFRQANDVVELQGAET